MRHCALRRIKNGFIDAHLHPIFRLGQDGESGQWSSWMQSYICTLPILTSPESSHTICRVITGLIFSQFVTILVEFS